MTVLAEDQHARTSWSVNVTLHYTTIVSSAGCSPGLNTQKYMTFNVFVWFHRSSTGSRLRQSSTGHSGLRGLPLKEATSRLMNLMTWYSRIYLYILFEKFKVGYYMHTNFVYNVVCLFRMSMALCCNLDFPLWVWIYHWNATLIEKCIECKTFLH